MTRQPGAQPPAFGEGTGLRQDSQAFVPTGAQEGAKVRQAREIIEAEYGSPLSLDQLAARVGVSKYHLCRAFCACYGMTPGNYLISVRLEEAKRLLSATRMPIKKVGLRVGYPNESYFSAMFRRHCGLSPRAFRAQAEK